MNNLRSFRQRGVAGFRAPNSPNAWTRTALFVITVVGLLDPATSRAGANTWTSNGPYGGNVSVLVADPQTPTNLYAAGFSGIYKSSDGGANWALSSSGINDPTVQSIAIDPVTPTTLYAGTNQGGPLVKSTDGGNTWTALAKAPTLVVALAINPQSTGTLYASQNQSGLFKSTDAGANWSKVQISAAPTFPTFKVLAIDPKSPNTLYAGERTAGIFKSSDGGMTWAAANTGFTGPVIQVLALAVDPQTTSTLYAAANTSGGSGLFKSADGGATWSNVLSDPSGVIGVQSIGVDPVMPSTVYIGTFSQGLKRSSNGGASFGAANSGLPQVGINAIAINPKNNSAVLVGTQNGVFASVNAAGSWAGASNGLLLTTVNALAVDPSVPTTVYAATESSGIFKSVDGGGSWTGINTGIGPTGNLAVNAPSFTALAIDPATPDTVYVAARYTESSSVYKSVDGGAHWTAAAGGLPFYASASSLAIDASAPSNVYVGMLGQGLFKSSDGAATWSAANGVPGSDQVSGVSVAAAPGVASTVVASTLGDGLYLSNDNGETFGSLLATYTSTASIGPTGTGITATTSETACQNNYKKASAEYVKGGGTGLTQTQINALCDSSDSDLGLGFFITFGAFDAVSSPAASMSAPGKLPSAQSRRNATSTKTVSAVPWALPDGSSTETGDCAPVTSIVENPQDVSEFYVGADCGVLHGTNNGQQLVEMSAGLLPGTQVNAVAISPDGSTIYAAAQGNGVHGFSKSSSTGPAVNLNQFGLTGAWYNPATSGQGLLIEVLPDFLGAGQGLLFAGWFTYDVAPAGGADKQRWYTLQGAVSNTSSSATIPIYASYGGNFNALPALGAPTQVGQVVLTFSDCTHATLAYSFSDGSGRASSMPLERLSTNVSCTASGSGSVDAPSSLLSGAWFDPNTGGQGFVFDVNPVEHVLFAAWYTYAPTGQTIGGPASQRWYTLQMPFTAGITSLSNIPVFAATGGIFDNPTPVATPQVGTANLTFQSCTTATLTYTFSSGTNQGLTGSTTISRSGLAPAGCSL